jgi:carbonic anhydrase
MQRLTTAWGVLTALVFLSTTVWATTIPAQRMFTPDEAMTQLRAGNDRFATGHAIHPNQDRQRLGFTTTGGQHPFATVIACSDSRVPVEILFDQGVGDLFVIRVAGNVLDVDEIGSVEYGVDHLETPIMLVLGHTHCGAVTAVVHDEPVHGSIPQLVDNILPAVEKTRQNHPGLSGDALITAAVINNVWQGITDLLMHSPVTRERIASGSLQVVGAIYDTATGRVDWLGTHPRQADILAAAQPGANVHDAQATGKETVAPAHKPAPVKTEAEGTTTRPEPVIQEESPQKKDGHFETANSQEGATKEASGQQEAMITKEEAPQRTAGTESEPATPPVQEAAADQKELKPVERHAQKAEAETAPEPGKDDTADGLWTIFFLLLIILVAVGVRSRKNKEN